MRVLVIDEWIPLPLESGKKIRTFHLLSPLANKHEITYLCYANAITEEDKIKKMKDAGFKVITVPPPNRFSSTASLLAGFALNLFSPLPLVLRKHQSRSFNQTFQELLKESFDLVHCEWTHYACFLRDAKHIPKFLSSHNVECMQWKRFAQVQSNLFRKVAIHLEWLKMRRFEESVIPIFDHVAAVSVEDSQLLQLSFGAHSTTVIANGVDSKYYEKIKLVENDHNLLVFCASMDTFVNQDAAIYFAKKILPIIHKKKPTTRFLILGKNPSPSVRNLASDRIIVSGSVDDVRPFIAKGKVSVVPLRIAGGSRLKILEAFASGLPVVSTTIGAEGLMVSPGKNICIADDAREFAQTCVNILDNPFLQTELAKNARRLVYENYDWGVISPKIESAWITTIKNFQSQKS